MSYNLKKFFRNFGGLNLADSELLKDDTIATDLLNTKFGDNLSKIKRRGHKRDVSGIGGNGCITYVNRNISGQSTRTERIVVSDRLHRLVDEELVISYSNTNTPSISFEIVDGVYTLLLYVDGNEVFRYVSDSLNNNGLQDQVSSLVTAINAVPDFSATSTNDANINLLNATNLTSFEGSLTINYSTYEEIPFFGPTAPFAAHFANQDNDDFELTDHIQARGSIYFTDVESGLWKYDGINMQKVPNFKTPPVTTSAITSTGNYLYKVLYKFEDSQGNVSFSTPSDILDSPGQASDLLLNPLTPATSPYNTLNATQIILRTVDQGNTFFVLAEVPITDTTYTDTTDDAILLSGEAFTEPQFTVVNDANYAYIDIFRDQIVLSGNPENVDETAYEDLVTTEAFFSLNTFITESRDGGANSGIKSLDNVLYVFKSNSVFIVTGELDTNKFQVDTLSDEGIGCLSNKSLIEYQRRIWFLGAKGIYSVGANSLQLESRPISPLFQKELRKVTSLRAFSLNWLEEDVLLINLPERVLGNRFSNSSRTLVHHSKTGTWSVFNNHNFANGADNFEFKIFFASDTTFSNGVNDFEINTSLHTNSKLDYADNEEAISWLYASNWETYGEPSIPKKYVRLKLYSLDTPLQNFDQTRFTIDITTQHEYEYETVSTASLSFNEEDSGWGIEPWGFFGWGNIRNRTRRTRLQPKKTRSIRVLLSNNAIYENVLLTGYEFEVAVEHDSYARRR